MNCTHPDHKDGVSCEDYAVACSKDCTCCLTPEWFESQKLAQIFADAIQAAKDGKSLKVNPHPFGSLEWHWFNNSFIDFLDKSETAIGDRLADKE
jgi:hypothetical protein